MTIKWGRQFWQLLLQGVGDRYERNRIFPALLRHRLLERDLTLNLYGCSVGGSVLMALLCLESNWIEVGRWWKILAVAGDSMNLLPQGYREQQLGLEMPSSRLPSYSFAVSKWPERKRKKKEKKRKTEKQKKDAAEQTQDWQWGRLLQNVPLQDSVLCTVYINKLEVH